MVVELGVGLVGGGAGVAATMLLVIWKGSRPSANELFQAEARFARAIGRGAIVAMGVGLVLAVVGLVVD